MGQQSALRIPIVAPGENGVRWFSGIGCVVHGECAAEVFVGGTLVGGFGPRDVAARNLLLIGLAGDRRIRKGKLAKAFGVSSEQLRRIRRQVESGGLQAVPARPRGGSQTKVGAPLRKRLFELFDGGASAYAAHRHLAGKRGRLKLSYSTVGRLRQVWAADRAGGSDADATLRQEAAPAQAELPLVATGVAAEATTQSQGARSLPAEEMPAQEPATDEQVQGEPVRGGRFVQHLGGWLLLGAVHAMGLHQAVLSRWQGGKEWLERFRLVIDAVVVSLGLGERCVEGVRRLATPSGALLLRADRMPSESCVPSARVRDAVAAGGLP
jgi:hypothetical protein